MMSLDIESNRCRTISTKHEQQCHENYPDDGWWSNKDIAEKLFISMKTVSDHITNIFSKLQVVDRAQAILRAGDAGREGVMNFQRI